jgi:hypothetical protein
VETRSALRQEREEKKQQKEKPVKRRHPAFIIWGTVLLTLLTLSMILNQTILNARFAVHEITTSNLSTTLMDNVNQGLSQYGISSNVISSSESNKLIKQAVNQVYSGKEINLNLQSEVNNVGDSVSQAAAKYGISASIPSSVTSEAGSNISNAVNSQLNTPQVKQLTNGITIAKTVDHIVMIGSLIGLIVMAIMALPGRHLLGSFSWIGLWGTIIVYALILGLSAIISQVGAQFPDYSTFTAQLATDFQSQAQNIWIVLLIITIILFLVRIGGRIVKRQ